MGGSVDETKKAWDEVAEGFAKLGRMISERYQGLNHGKRVAQLFEDLGEAGLWAPTFIVDYPVEVSPLSKARPDDPTTDRHVVAGIGALPKSFKRDLRGTHRQLARLLKLFQDFFGAVFGGAAGVRT